jgi:mitochondrial fission protein ELM1
MTATPRIWLLIGDKLGDNAQARAVVDALGWPYAVRQLFPKPEWVLGKPKFEPGLAHLDPERSASLEPPWPDLIVTIGRRPAMAALWVQDQSGGRTRIALLGRPKRWAERFALIVAPSQFKIPPRENLVQLDLPLLRADPTAVAEAGEAWRARLEALPRPLTAVLIGGQTKPYRFDADVARQLLAELEALRGRDGGTLFLTTSRRTRPEVVATLERDLPAGAVLHRWSAEGGGENPYLGLLALADRFVVTSDSISMLVEVASLRRPLAIFELPVGGSLSDWGRAVLARVPLPPALSHFLHGRGILGYGRDLGEIRRRLIETGRAVRLGEPFLASGAGMVDELDEVIRRIRAICPAATGGSPA